MTARVRRQGALVLTWIMLTTSATAMAWWSVTFVTAAVADRRPLRPSDVVAASVRRAAPVPVPTFVYRAQPVGPPPEQTVSPLTAVVVEAAAVVPASRVNPAPPATKPSVGAGSRRTAVPAITHPAVTVQVASWPKVPVQPASPVPPVPAPETIKVAAVTAPIRWVPKTWYQPEAPHPSGVPQGTPVNSPVDRMAAINAVAPKRQIRHWRHCDLPAAANPPA